jgi:hypothetical protein
MGQIEGGLQSMILTKNPLTSKASRENDMCIFPIMDLMKYQLVQLEITCGLYYKNILTIVSDDHQ